MKKKEKEKKNPKVNIEYMEPTDKSPEKMFEIIKTKLEAEHGPIKSGSVKKFVGDENDLKEFIKNFDKGTQEEILTKMNKMKPNKNKQIKSNIILQDFPDIINEYVDKTNMVFFALNYITNEIKKDFNSKQYKLLDEISAFENEYMHENKQSIEKIIMVYKYVKEWESRAIKAQIFSLDNIDIREEEEHDCEHCENTGCNEHPKNKNKNKYKISEKTDNTLLN